MAQWNVDIIQHFVKMKKIDGKFINFLLTFLFVCCFIFYFLYLKFINFFLFSWYKFDDNYVSQIDKSEVISSAAYILFYSCL